MGNGKSTPSDAGMSIKAKIYQNKEQNLNWEQFLAVIKHMNRHYAATKGDSGDYLCFALNKNSEMTVFWKQQVRIMCFKVNSTDRKIISCKQLTFQEFMNVYNLKKSVGDMDAPGNVDEMTQSRYIFGQTADQDGKCCVCMERDIELMLPCLHSFCLTCVIREDEYRPPFKCFLCKTSFKKPADDAWEVPDIPTQSDIDEYLNDITR